MYKKTLSALSLGFFFFASLGTFAQEKEKDRLFDSQEPLALKMNTSIKDLKSQTNETTFISQEISVQNQAGEWEAFPFEIRTRGNFRLDNCFYPPTRIKLEKETAKGTIFQGSRRLKLVLPCSRGKNADSFVGKEYVAYKMYDLVGKYTFQTRLVKVTFTNLDDKKGESVELLGFVIEDDDDAAERFDGEILDGTKIPPQIMQDTATVIHDFYQMMIGNTDWSGLYQHNEKVMKLDEKTVVPIAYDFDMTGLVNPPYSQVNSNISISKVTERLYRGFCRDEAMYQYVRKLFLEKENEIMGLIPEYQAYYAEADVKTMNSFVSEFFNILKSDKLFQAKIVESCRKPDGSYGF